MFDNLILNSDSYKCSHYLQYPPGTTNIHSYIESRGGRWNELRFFGLQHLLKEYLSMPIIGSDVDHAEKLLKAHGVPFNREGWDYIVAEHSGYLPIKIRAIPEGTVVPVLTPLVTVEATDPKCAWVVSYIEPLLLKLWYATTVATLSYNIRKSIKRHLLSTADNLDGLPFKLHDFGCRGVSSVESAGIGGLAHLVNFMGTDTIPALVYAQQYYGHEDAAGFSVAAAEHSTITSWGKDGEVDAFRNMLNQFGKPGAIVSVVSDSYDIYNAVDNIWGQTLRQQVVESGATLVIRPDSGDPATVVLKCLQLIDQRFGSTYNSKGFKLLNNVRVLQGDGINSQSIELILNAAESKGYSADNLVFGVGGGLLQDVNRDTLKFAMKVSAAEVDGEWRDVYKDPITDPGKVSKKGRQDSELMRDVFLNGNLLVEDTLDTVRSRA